jgi:hypothetical protein
LRTGAWIAIAFEVRVLRRTGTRVRWPSTHPPPCCAVCAW